MASNPNERELVTREPLFAALAQGADAAGLGVAVTIIEEPMRTVFVNEGLARLVGTTAEALLRIPVFQLIAPEELPRLQQMLQLRRRDEPTPFVYQTLMVRHDGERVPVEISTSRIMLDQQQANVTYVIDITRRKQADVTSERAESLLRSLVASAPDGIVILRGPFIVFANPAASRLLGSDRPEDVLGRPIVELLHPDDAKVAQERIQSMLRSGAKHTNAYQYRPAAERVRHTVVEISSVPIDYEGAPAVLAFARDVTERKALEARLIRSDRLAALGTLAAGVAHEINNPLAYVLLNLQFLERKLPQLMTHPELMETFLKRLRDAVAGAQRVGTIVRDLRTFARPDEESRGPVDIGDVIESSIRMAHHEMRHRAQVIQQLPTLPMIDGNVGRLEQLFLNLLVNAAHAMDANQLERNQISINARNEDNGTISIEVADNGCGMPPEVLDRVFDPFFTTKPIGQGSGLGLPICQSIVHSLGGNISIHSEVGRGTKVTVTLVAHRPLSNPPPRPEVTVTTDVAQRGRLLIVDDEPIVAETLAQLLSDRHDVDVATSASRALEHIAQFQGYDVILCDLVMPGMTGMQLHATLTQAHPVLAQRMLFMTGGAFLPEAEAFLRDGNRQAIQKPFDLDGLTKLIDRAMLGDE